MRTLSLALLTAVVLSCGFAARGLAMPMPGDVSVAGTSPIIEVDRRCGFHRHYVPRYRHHGHWAGGYCARDRRR
jgi:hypothetical protein